MNEERFLDALREEARSLQYEPADRATWTRMSARISERLTPRRSAADLLAQWFRPVALALAVSIAVTGSAMFFADRDTPDDVGTVAEAALMQEDFYRVVQ